MYSIIGADEQEYGPVEAETLAQWAREGRVIERTTILDHATGRRYLACDMAELSTIFQPKPMVAPPVMAPAKVARGARPPATVTTPGVLVTGKPRRSRVVAGILGIFLGWLGVHRFYLGYTGVGTAMLFISLFTCFIATPLTLVWGLIEGILCLTGAMTDADGRKLGV